MGELKKPFHWMRMSAVWVVVTLLLLFLIEGAASFIHVTRAVILQSPRRSADRIHTRYDSELGWVNIPNVFIPDLYGPGVYLRANSQGFRNNEDFTADVPAGKYRVICSGDSFALGYGVSNDDNWCQVLTRLDERLQTVNLGQGGYGIDQSYLLFLREGMKLQHNLHILSVIDDDFQRMTYAVRNGYSKPRLELANGQLVVRNVPVPKPSQLAIRLGPALSALGTLRTIQAVSWISKRLSSSADGASAIRRNQQKVFPVAMKVFAALRDLGAQSGSQFVLVYFPRETDGAGDSDAEALRRDLKLHSEQAGIRFWDLTGDFQNLPLRQFKSMFIPPGKLPYSGASGHYTPEGNRFVAELLYQRMRATPEIKDSLEGMAGRVPPRRAP
jgi:hypothetical protein